MTCSRWALVFGMLATAPLVALGCGDDDDSAPEDAGGGGEDAGMDAAVSVLACEGSVEDVYVTPEGLPAFTEDARGEVVRCAKGDPLTVERMEAVGETHGYDGPALTQAAERYYLSYRTPRATGEGALSSAILYVPTEMPDTPQPLVVALHGTTGLGNPCAPSRADPEADYMEDAIRLILPLVGDGRVVIAPDYIGMGTEGTTGFLVVDEAAHTTLDAIRAALQVAPEGLLSGDAVLVGHSQGGHAAMVAQAAQAEYAPELSILGVSAYAPAWLDLTGVGLLFTAPGEPTDGRVNFAAMYSIGHQAAYFGEDAAYQPFDADLRADVQDLYENNCHWGQPERLAAIAPTVGDLFSSSFRDSVAKCVNLGLCDDRGEFYRDRLNGHRPDLAVDGVPVRVHAGSEDTTVGYEPIACAAEDMKAAGMPVDTCIYEGSDHQAMAVAPAAWTMSWIDALVAGEAEPSCTHATFCDAPADGGVSDGGVSDGGVADAGVDGG